MSKEWDDHWYKEDDDFYEDIFKCLNELFELVRIYLNQNCSKEVFYKNE